MAEAATMMNPFYGAHLQADEWEAFQAEYDEWLALVSEARSGGQVPQFSDFQRADESQKARRVRRLASRLVGREVR